MIMKIQELTESFRFKESDYVTRDKSGRAINYDLLEDVVYFINNDDEIYRKLVFPLIIKYKHPDPTHCIPVIQQGYESYKKRYPIKLLPDTLSRVQLEKAGSLLSEICKDET